MKDTDYILIQPWMVKNLKLSGNKLIMYALIHGFCKDGEHEFHGSINYMCEWTNLSRNTVISTLKSLVDDRFLTKREYKENNVSFCAYSLGGSEKTALPVQSTKKFQEEEQEKEEKEKVTQKEKEKKEEKEEKENITFVENFIERIYKIYPTRCPKRNTSLGKCSKDKERIRRLMKAYTQEDIERVVRHEVEEKYGKSYMQNFSTFLNNFPDPSEMFSSENVAADNSRKEEALLKRFYETLSAEEEAKIYGLVPFAFSALTSEQKNWWRKEKRQIMLEWIKCHDK